MARQTNKAMPQLFQGPQDATSGVPWISHTINQITVMVATSSRIHLYRPLRTRCGARAASPQSGDPSGLLVGGHRILVDQPVESRGDDKAPTPTELFVASLAACVAYYAGRYLARHGLDRKGLRIRAGFTMAMDRPARVSAIRVEVHPPDGFPAERIAALTAVVNACTIHNTLDRPPKVDVSVS